MGGDRKGREMYIRSAKDQPAVRQAGGNYRRWLAQIVEMRWPGMQIDWRMTGRPVVAEINHSNWVAKCPDCPESVIVEVSDPVFFCPDCCNAGNHYHARPVVFPKDRARIEEILQRRPLPQNRNWMAGETVADLIAENIAHGVEG